MGPFQAFLSCGTFAAGPASACLSQLGNLYIRELNLLEE